MVTMPQRKIACQALFCLIQPTAGFSFLTVAFFGLSFTGETAMRVPFARSFLTLSVAVSLAACSPSSPPTPSQPPVSASQAAVQQPAEPIKPRLTPEQEARVQALSVSLRPDNQKEAYPTATEGNESYVELPPETPFLVCVSNTSETSALISVSIQGVNIDLQPAHTHEPLLNIMARSTRCLPEFKVAKPDENKPPLVAWTLFLAEGQDGSAIKDIKTAPAAEGRIWLGKPNVELAVEPWPGLKPAEASTGNSPQAPGAAPSGEPTPAPTSNPAEPAPEGGSQP